MNLLDTPFRDIAMIDGPRTKTFLYLNLCKITIISLPPASQEEIRR